MTVAEIAKKFDVVGFIMECETEGFDQDREDHVETLQHMIDTGIVWQLQGSWQRFARSCIEAGVVRAPA